MKRVIVGKHMKDCGAVRTVAQGDWDHPWCSYVEKSVSSRKNSIKARGYWVWWVFKCNSIACQARLYVRADDSGVFDGLDKL